MTNEEKTVTYRMPGVAAKANTGTPRYEVHIGHHVYGHHVYIIERDVQGDRIIATEVKDDD